MNQFPFKKCAYMSVQKGFTLIELLIVMAIIGMLAALVGPSIMGKFGDAQRNAAASQLKSIEVALDAHRLDTGKYPKTLEGLNTNTVGSKLWDGPYMKKGVPNDPWGNPYQYREPGQKGDYDLFSFGADGVEGGEEDNADIGKE
jgi:general secretion pathway protein G